MSKIAVIRVRGGIKVKKEIKDTLTMLKLYRKNYCTVFEATPSIIGMVKKVKDYVTYGEIEDGVYKELVEKRGESSNDKKSVEINGKKYKAYFRLNPPKKGFGRKGIKTAFSKSGALGYRGSKINDLIKRML